MLKLVKYIEYDGNYAYAPPELDALINTDDIIAAKLVPKEQTRKPFDDITRIAFRNNTWMDVICKPQDFIEIKSAE